MNVSDYLKWIKTAFAVQSIKGSEVNMSCPFCGHPRFYFNWRKQIGFCHRASCGRKPTLGELINLKGYGPTDYYTAPEKEAEKPPTGPVELPESWDVTDVTDIFAVQALATRGITPEQIIKWGIRASNDRIIVPIYHEGKLLQWLGRSIDRATSPSKAFRTPHATRFKYAKGLPVSHFLFGWEEAKHWEQIVLVESTFNAIAWREKLNSITNFGSNLSDMQMNLLKYSKAKLVTFAWDKDAYGKAWKAATKLQKVYGVPTAVVKLTNYNQPDDVPFHILEATIHELQNEPKAPHHFGPLLKEI